MAAGLEDAVDLGHHVHRIGEQMLDQFAAEHRVERRVGVREDVALGIEMIDVALEGLAVFGDDRLVIDLPELAVIAAAHLAVAQLELAARA